MPAIYHRRVIGWGQPAVLCMMMPKLPHAMPYPFLLALLAMSLPPRALRAQEFTQQSMLVVPFRADSAPGLLDEAHKVSDGVRNRLGKLIPEREVEVLSNARLNALLIKSNYRRNSQMSDIETRLAASELRADEIVFGRVQREGRTFVVHARLARIRGWSRRARSSPGCAAAKTRSRKAISPRPPGRRSRPFARIRAP
jgi:hypothetical protein